ncbi:hypothetical protein GTR02_10620, partial [Kineococcus sp. R8]|uniref:carbohydrate-binding domain-containing protein n=1 Tax=Kineococcus siccus TaxID=2696567 RepID=UPI0030B82D47|nr:hypothetical protein [Kineococcus siccus]
MIRGLSPVAASPSGRLARTARGLAAAAPAALVASALLAPAPAVGATPAAVPRVARTTPHLEGERLALPSSAGLVTQAAGASGGAELLVWSDATATGTLTTTAAASGLSVLARGDQCAGAPSMTVSVDGRVAATVSVTSPTWAAHRLPGTWPAGPHLISVAFTNDARSPGCDRNLRVDRVSMPSSVPAAPAPRPAPAPAPAPARAQGRDEGRGRP